MQRAVHIATVTFSGLLYFSYAGHNQSMLHVSNNANLPCKKEVLGLWWKDIWQSICDCQDVGLGTKNEFI